ncbi:MAG: hypothetical protein L3J23_05895 [Flavobacteriaceae bacterium]|nr:hypothetical protein [Flavobacteriaceae bacterium]
MRYSVFILFFILISCDFNQKRKKENPIETEKENLTLLKTEIKKETEKVTELQNEYPNWLNKIYSENKTEISKEIIKLEKYNDSISIVLFEKNTGVCNIKGIETYKNKTKISELELETNCDKEQSRPDYKWKEYKINNEIYTVSEFYEKINDTLITNEGFIKRGYDFDELENKIDTIIKKYIINSYGKIKEINYNWEFIKSKTSDLTQSFNIKNFDIYKLNKVPKEFLIQFVKGKKIQFGFPKTLPIDYPTEFRFYQHKEFNDFYFFSFIHANETCCRTLYGISLNKKDLKVINIATFALTGGDGGWSENDIGNWKTEYLFEVKKAEFLDKEIYENIEFDEIDTLFAQIKIDKKGIFEWKKLDSVKYRNGKLIK